MLEGLVSVVSLTVIGAGVAAFVASRSRHAGPVVAAFVAHVVLGLALWHSLGFYSPDAVTYDWAARGYLNYWNGMTNVPPPFSGSKVGWVLILATTYRLLGAYPELGIIVNAIASAFTASLVMGATVRLGFERHARVAGYLLLLPAFLFWSSLLLRESVAWMLTALALWAGAGLVKRYSLGGAFWLAVAIAGSVWIRGSLAAVLAAGVVGGVILGRRRVPLPVLALATAGALFAGSYATTRLSTVTGGVDLEQINAARRSLSTAGSGFAVDTYTGPASMLKAVPTTFPHAALGPFPWELPHLPVQTIGDWAGWILLLWLTWRGFRRNKGRAKWLCVVSATAILVVIGVTSGNYGTMVRLRPTAAILMLPLAAAGWGRKRSADDDEVEAVPLVDRRPHRRATASRA